jgi:hypothetical protein
MSDLPPTWDANSELPHETIHLQTVTPPMPRRPGFVRFLYTSNPFYLISAGLVFVGLRVSFDTDDQAFNAAGLAISLATYTALLAVTAGLIIRLGNVWDDARSLLLVVVLMLLALSITFDDVLAIDWTTGAWCAAGGLLFAGVTSEVLLRSIRLNLPWLFRGPYYLLLTLFFLYPVGLGHLRSQPSNSWFPWALLAFSILAAVALLSLWPAARRGAAYTLGNGSPWPWPLYPWSLFVVLIVGVLGRSYYLSISFDNSPGWNHVFDYYFLVPILIAVALVVLEIGRTAGSRITQQVAVWMPAGLLVLAALHRADPAAQVFADTFTDTVGGSPLFVTLWLAIVVQGCAALRRTYQASTAATISVALLSIIHFDSETLGRQLLHTPLAWPILVAAIIQSGLGLWKRNSAHVFLGVCCALMAALIEFRATALVAQYGIVPLNLVLALLASMLLVGAVFSDGFAHWLREGGKALLVLANILVLTHNPKIVGHLEPLVLYAYPLAFAIVAAGYGYLLGTRGYYPVAFGSFLVGITGFGWHAYLWALRHVRGLDKLVLGAASFLLAALISLLKIRKSRRDSARAYQQGSLR